MKVLMMTQHLEKDHWLLGFIHTWVAELAQQVEQLAVIALSIGKIDLPHNVAAFSLGKELGLGRVARAQRLASLLKLALPGKDVFFSHLSDTYPLLAAPFCRWRGIPMTMWYTHRSVTWRLRLSEKLVQRIYTASPESLQLHSHKTRVLGHGIDTGLFTPAQPNPNGRIVSVGRITPIKNLHLLIEALPEVPQAQVVLVGAPALPSDEGYQAQLQTRIAELGLQGRVVFAGGCSPAQTAAHYQAAQFSINLAPTGGLDKVVLESMACGTPALAFNRTFAPLFGEHTPTLQVPELTPSAIAQQLKHALALSPSAYQQIASQQHARVLAEYSLPSLMHKLHSEFAQLKR
jgi:glycosyltransferase involved in cell wall biosynthesis